MTATSPELASGLIVAQTGWLLYVYRVLYASVSCHDNAA